MSVATVRTNRLAAQTPRSRRTSGPVKSPAALHEQKVLWVLKITDRIQLGVFAAGLAALLLVYYASRPTSEAVQIILVAVTVFVLASELWMAYKTRYGILRARSVILIAFYEWALARPMIMGIKESGYGLENLSISDKFYAVIVVFFFICFVYVGYMIRGPKRGFFAQAMEDIVPSLSSTVAFWLVVCCFVPEMIHRWALIDWSRTQNIVMALLGLEGSASFHTGRLGDIRVFWRPAVYLFDLLTIVATVGFIKNKGRTDLRLLILLMGGVAILGLCLGWSRYKLAQGLFGPLALLLCVTPPRKQKFVLALVVVAVVGYIPISQMMAVGRNGRWFMESMETFGKVRSAGLESLLEDDISPLAQVVKVTPSKESYKPFYDIYYLVGTAWVPRILWPGKPAVDQKYLGNRRPYYCAVTLAGDVYICGGLWHVAVASILFGVVVRMVDNFSQPWKPMQPEYAVVHLALAWLLFVSARSTWSIMMFGFPVFCLFALMYAFRIVRGRATRRQQMHSLRRRQLRRIANRRSLQPAMN